MMQIKVCGMRDPENIRQLMKVGVDYIGFIFYPQSKRYAGNHDVSQIVSAVTKGTKKVGVFVNESIDNLLRIHKKFQLDYVQLHGGAEPEYCEELIDKGIKIIKVFSVDNKFYFKKTKPFKDKASFFLFDTRCTGYGGSGQKFNWDIFNRYDNEVPIFLSGGIGPDDAELVHNLPNLNIAAVDINSRFESEPGLKQIDKVEKFKSELLARVSSFQE